MANYKFRTPKFEKIRYNEFKNISLLLTLAGMIIFTHDFYYHLFKDKDGAIDQIHHGYIGLLMMLLGFVTGLNGRKK